MKTWTLILTLIVLAVTAVLAQQPAEQEATEAVKADVAAVAQANNAFGCDLYAELRAKPGNLFLSPASVYSALAMAYTGAAGRTAEQMADTLHFALPADRLHAAFGRLTRELNDPPKLRDVVAYQLVVSNALWLQEGYPFKESFTQRVKADYEAGLNTVNYAQPAEARETINAWVEKATNEKIKDLIPPGVLNEMTRLVLTNAVYFKSDWADTFSEHSTKDAPFHLADGKTVTAPLMHQWTHIGYMETDEFQLADIPYKAGVLSMTILLPREADGLAALEKRLTAENLTEWIAKARSTHVDLNLPRFKFTSQFGLGKPLAALGMTDAFEPDRADFSGMTTAEKLFIAAVLHKAFVAVDEKGTEAAAATAVMVGATAMPQKPQVIFRADRPFVFLICHRPTGAVLFLGRLANPVEK